MLGAGFPTVPDMSTTLAGRGVRPILAARAQPAGPLFDADMERLDGLPPVAPPEGIVATSLIGGLCAALWPRGLRSRSRPMLTSADPRGGLPPTGKG